jgi:hypothetical protein
VAADALGASVCSTTLSGANPSGRFGAGFADIVSFTASGFAESARMVDTFAVVFNLEPVKVGSLGACISSLHDVLISNVSTRVSSPGIDLRSVSRREIHDN